MCTVVWHSHNFNFDVLYCGVLLTVGVLNKMQTLLCFPSVEVCGPRIVDLPRSTYCVFKNLHVMLILLMRMRTF